MKVANAIYSTLGASNHSSDDREQNDFYATEPKAVELLLKEETFTQIVLEPACGKGHISEALKKDGYVVFSYDKIARGYGGVKDFFTVQKWEYDIITNPPYKIAMEFIEKALSIVPEKRKVAMFCRLLFLEGQKRKKLFLEQPPKIVYVSSGRLKCAKNGDFEKYGSSAQAYAWYVWEKGFKGSTTIKWIN